MLKSINKTSHLPMQLLYKTVFPLLCFFLLIHLLAGSHPLFADDFSSENYKLTFEQNLLNISAKNADLKNILVDIADKTNISIRYPASLDKKITIKIDEISLREALERLLKDFDYSIIYSGSKKQAAISDVFIFKQNKKTTPQNTDEKRVLSRIKQYERRIESLKKNLSKVDENSTRGKSYLNRIKSYEKKIEEYRSQL